MMRQTACAWRFLPAMIGGGTWREPHARHEAARVLSASRRRGCRVAARGARAAGGQDRARWIPKADGRQRPLGIAALEDKIVQAAVVAILTPIYEAEFLGFSYGFRPERRQHQALDALAFGSGRRRINWVLMPPTYVKAYLKRGKNDGRCGGDLRGCHNRGKHSGKLGHNEGRHPAGRYPSKITLHAQRDTGRLLAWLETQRSPHCQ